jgi:hypothetical protein
MGRDFVDLKDGDTLEPYHLNQIYKELRRWRKLGGSGRVTVDGAQDGESVPTINVALSPQMYVGVANGVITARSGTTAGSGTVTIKQINGNSIQTAQITNLAVKNPSSTTMTSGDGIDSGQYVKVWKDAFGDWIVEPMECS